VTINQIIEIFYEFSAGVNMFNIKSLTCASIRGLYHGMFLVNGRVDIAIPISPLPFLIKA